MNETLENEMNRTKRAEMDLRGVHIYAPDALVAFMRRAVDLGATIHKARSSHAASLTVLTTIMATLRADADAAGLSFEVGRTYALDADGSRVQVVVKYPTSW